jgi:hypothetical protein
MIWVLTGVPGSGKTYFAVDMINDLLQKLKKKEKINDKEAQEKIKVLHNVDGLKVGTVLDTFCAERDLDLITPFTDHYHKDNEEFRGWLFVVDECQTLFPKNMRNEQVQRFFQMHRHYGIDVVLLSQDYKLICPAISLLSEFQYRAVSDTANPLPATFMYKQMIGYEEIGRKFKIKKKQVFNLYKTADFDQKKVKKKARPMLIVGVICLLLAIFGVYKVFTLKDGINSPSSNKAPKLTKQEQKNLAQKRQHQKQPQPFTQNGYTDSYEKPYPDSYLQKLNSFTLLPLDKIEDSTGKYFILMGTLWPAKDLPYKVIKTRLGYSALVPLDIYEYEKKQKILLAEAMPDHPDNIIDQETKYFEPKE